MILYLIKMLGIQVGGLLIYHMVLRNTTLFSHSRKFLWVVLLSSFLVPLVPSTYFNVSSITTAVDEVSRAFVLPEISITLTAEQTIGIEGLLLMLYGIITLTFILRLLNAYLKIVRLKNRTPHAASGIFFSKEVELPFSFLHWIFIPTSFKHRNDLPLIVAHEQAHVKMKHSWDKIIITFLSSICWLNPLLRLFHRELELIHEFQVDEAVAQAYPKEKYLETLVQTTIYSKRNAICLTHSFFSSPIKNRIIMLHKNSKNPLLKKTLSSLAVLLMLVGFLSLQSNVTTAQVSAQEVVNPPVPPPPPPAPPAPPTDDIVEKASFPGGMNALIEYMQQNIKYPAKAKKAGMEGKLLVQFVVNTNGSISDASVVQIDVTLKKRTDEEGLDKLLEKEAIRVINAMPKWSPAIKSDGTAVKSRNTLPITFKMK